MVSIEFFAKPEDIDPEKFLLATYYIESDLTLREAGVRIAREESIGTWTEVTTTTTWIKRKLPAKVFKFGKGKIGNVSIAYPIELFDLESGGIPNILSIVAGNLFGLTELSNVRLLDVQFPKQAVSYFPGPKFGIEGIRRIAGTLKQRRPHLGTIIKPKVGLSPKQTAQVAYEAAVGGVDFIKDDETLTNQKFCPLVERVSEVMEALDKAKEETDRSVFYAVNVTATHNKLVELAEQALVHGANMLMIDVLTTGFSAIQTLAQDPSIKVPLHIHRTMHAAITRNPRHGIHMMFLAKLVRLAGGDQLHIGSAAGKMEREVKGLKEINNFLKTSWFELKPMFPVASGGIHPGIVAHNIEVLGVDCVINAGGGIHGHPLGTRAGAIAMRQAIDAALKQIPVKEYAKTHQELKLAIEKWGTKYAEKLN
ncbi:MAG: RuBisCO large subunit C-terminal-like domain-containing protein [Candidatus Bathyarchaeia archaeon]